MSDQYKCFEIRNVAICKICGQMIKQYATGTERYASCSCGNVWRSSLGTSIRWRRVEEDE